MIQEHAATLQLTHTFLAAAPPRLMTVSMLRKAKVTHALSLIKSRLGVWGRRALSHLEDDCGWAELRSVPLHRRQATVSSGKSLSH
jgi:hypothetical protein